MNKFKRFLSLVLVLCMVMAFVPVGASAADASYAYNIVHVDAGRKYFSVDSLKTIIDNAAAAGFNQVELYLSDNQGFRFRLDDMELTTEYGTYDLAPALGDGYSDSTGKAPDGTGKYLTQDEMDEIIAYANDAGIDIVPCINVPGHMGAILEEFPSFRYVKNGTASNSSISLDNAEAVAFALALTEKYASYFASRGCKYYSIGADEYANDLSSMGFEGMGQTLYNKFVAFMNDAADIILDLNMTPRAFNDGFYYGNYSVPEAINTAYEICYWSSGWNGYNVAQADELAEMGYKMINTNGDYYWVLGNSGWQCSASKASQFDETAFSGSTVSAPAGSMFCIWCDTGDADTEANVVSKTAPVIAAFGAAVPAVESLIESDEGSEPVETEPAETQPSRGETAPAVTEERTVTVPLGGSITDVITGGEYAADETELDKSIAAVSVTTTPAKETTVSYDAVSVTCNDLIDNNGTQEATGYYYKVGDNYYPVYASRVRNSYSNNRYDYTWYYSTDNGASFEEIGEQTYVRTGTAASITVYEKSGTEAVEASTTVTFRGVAKGTTYVTVGNVRYIVHVVDTPPTGALTSNSVTLEYWITNSKVHTSANSDAASSATIRTSDEGITSAEGVALTVYAPDSAYSGFDGWKNVTYWQSMRLDSDHIQDGSGNCDRTSDGVTMTHVRYYNGAWQYKNMAGNWNYFLSDDQLVAYYLLPTQVTDQIMTYTKDWGYDTGSTTPDTSGGIGQVALSFAVVDGSTLTPSEANIYSESTTIFNFWNKTDTGKRNIGIVAPESNNSYEIYKITVTAGMRTNNTEANVWYTSDTITWEKTTNDLGTGEWFNEREVWNISEGTTPSVSGVADNVVWPQKNSAFLILFYVRAKNADLTVRYVDDSLAGATITERGVFADQDENFYNMENTALPSADGEFFTLSDNASLTYFNYDTEKEITQTFQKSLLNFQDIAPQYRSGAYKYVGAELADNGTTLILHYNIDESVLDPRYVVDFGLPVSVPLNKIIDNYGTADITSVQMMNAAYGTAVIADGVLTYTPNAVLQSPAAVTLKVTYANGTVVPFNVGFVPASTVYYEEGFAAFTGSWTGASTGSGEQALQTASNSDGNYGYDAKYAAETGMSNGTQAVSKTSGDKAELTFTGTGIDIYANCDPGTSTVAVLLYREDGGLVKMYQVDTSAVSGNTGATAGQGITSFSLPIVSIQGLTHGTYRIAVLHTKAVSDTTAEFRLDGFRVYNTLVGNATADWAADENAPMFLELRNAVLAGYHIAESTPSDPYNWSGSIIEQVYNQEGSLTGALVLSGNAAVDATDLLENGPKNELFLRKNESVTFELAAGVKTQIGLKAVNGSVSYTVNGTAAAALTTATDLFYHEGKSGKITITNTGDNLLSVTKLKLFGAASAAEALVPISEELVIHALQSMGVIEKPVNPFVDVAEDSWYYDAVQWAVKEGITTGADATHFLPDALCQRATVVTMLWRAAGSPEPETTVNPFVDVTEGTFFYKAVLWAVEKGITTGVDATHFAPFGTCNRAQVVTFLWRANGKPAASAANPFADVAEGRWYTEAVLWAVENNITNGLNGKIFGVESLCNRAQIVTFLYRAAR